ncbi:hypothetical protein Tco_1457302 [Tanacetum coccineum]
MRSDGIEIQRCYLDYLEALVSHYKAARSSRNPTGGYEGIRRFEDYHGDGNMDGSLAAKEKGRVEHLEGGRGRQAQTNAYIILFGTLGSWAYLLHNKLMRSDGIEIQRCYLDYLEALVSHYKAARSSRNPTGGYEGIRRFEDYHGDGNMDGSLAAKEKGRVEHLEGGRGRQAQTNAYIILPMKIETSR